MKNSLEGLSSRSKQTKEIISEPEGRSIEIIPNQTGVEGKKQMIISIDNEKAFDKIQHSSR